MHVHTIYSISGVCQTSIKGICQSSFSRVYFELDKAQRQCSQPSSRSVFGGGRDGLWLIVCLFWVLGRTTPGRVRTGQTIGDYSPSAWIFGTSKVKIMRHDSCCPQQSPAVHCSLPSPYTPYYSVITHNLKPFFRVSKQSLSGLLHILL